MNSHVLAVGSGLSASPLAEGERIEVRGSTTGSEVTNPHPTLSTLHPGRDPREAHVALIV
jgi:hypothetical protein